VIGVFVYLRLHCVEIHRSGDEEGIVAAGDGVVKAPLVLQVGTEDLQGAESLQILEMGDLLQII
jgi:hypothetical protein